MARKGKGKGKKKGPKKGGKTSPAPVTHKGSSQVRPRSRPATTPEAESASSWPPEGSPSDASTPDASPETSTAAASTASDGAHLERQDPPGRRTASPAPETTRTAAAGGSERSEGKKGFFESMKPKGPAAGGSFREVVLRNVEMLAIAVVYALFIKFFVVEAFRIPSSSMETTVLGSPYISDKILVAKNHYLFFDDPGRWDVPIFRYPNNRSRIYVKRIAGMPGDWLMVRDGDVLGWDPEVADNLPSLQPFERPDPLVGASICYQVFPADDALRAALDQPAFDESKLRENFGEFWRVDGTPEDYDIKRGERRIFSLSEPPAPGEAPEIESWIRYHGMGLTTQMLTSNRSKPGGQIARNGNIPVEDLQLAFDLADASSARVEGGVFTLQGGSSATRPIQAFFHVDATAGTCGLSASRAETGGEGEDRRPVDIDLAEPVTVPIPPELLERLRADESIRLLFEHIDFQLRLWLDGKLVAELDYPVQRKATDGEVRLRFGARGYASFSNLYLARDIYYTAPTQAPMIPRLLEMGILQASDEIAGFRPSNVGALAERLAGVRVPSAFVNQPLLVPEDHYVLLGDNSPRSADSRHWHIAGYLEKDGSPRVWEEAAYARVPTIPDAYYDIFGRTFTPSRDRALLDPESGAPVLLGYWLVDRKLEVGFVDPTAEGNVFVDILGNRRTVEHRALPMHSYVLLHADSTGESAGESFSVIATAPPQRTSAGWTIQVADPSATVGLRKIQIDDPRETDKPSQFRWVQTPGIVWSPFVSRSQLLGKAFCIFWPGGIMTGGYRTVPRFSYIR